MSYTAQSATIAELMHDIGAGKYYLPAIQREFVWPAGKIEGLFDSLMRGYPIGILLLWQVRKPAIHDFQFYELLRDFDVRKTHNIKANLSLRDECFGILDGQQRVTSLFIGLLGSYTEKLPRLWWDNPDAFPRKRLYINLLYQPASADEQQRFQIKFLTERQANHTEQAYWFLIGDILKYSDKDALRTFRRATLHRDNDVFEDTLDRLWAVVFEQRNVAYFSETGQNLDEVLEIFVRLNAGGTPLSYSDLLLSLATATWKTHDAREEVYALVDSLNKQCGSFDFSKDFVLKTALVLSDGDVRFKAVNIRKKEGLENIWEGVERYLKLTALLLRDLGFTWQTLTATNAAIPIAYYLHRRGLDDGYRTYQKYATDRERIRNWLLKMLLGRVFGGQSDRRLTDIRRIIQGVDLDAGFPSDAIEDSLRAEGGLVFTPERISTFVTETSYGSPSAFLTLALLVPGLNIHHTAFHIDHLHPSSRFTGPQLVAAGMSTEDAEFALQHYNDLPNLSLLPGSENLIKSDQALADWLAQQSNPAYTRSVALLPDCDLSLTNFREFYEARTHLLIASLARSLGVVESTAMVDAEPIGEALVTGVDVASNAF